MDGGSTSLTYTGTSILNFRQKRAALTLFLIAAVWASDAEFAYWGRRQNNGFWSTIVCNGRYLELGGERLFSCSRPVLRCEIITTGEKIHVLCSDNEVLVVNDLLCKLWANFEPVM